MTTNLNQYGIAKSDPNSNNYAYYQKDLYNYPFTSQYIDTRKTSHLGKHIPHTQQ